MCYRITPAFAVNRRLWSLCHTIMRNGAMAAVSIRWLARKDAKAPQRYAAIPGPCLIHGWA